MPGFLWGSTEQKAREWIVAKEKLSQHGKLMPNGTKLRRKDYPGDLNHSFMVIDDRIVALSGKGIHLGSGRDAKAKLAENEAGNLIALKIITQDGAGSHSLSESKIASDLGIAGQRVTRTSASKKFPTKHYIAYQYLGTRLFDYLHANKALSLDKRYELCIKTSLALHEIHTGKKSKSKTSYMHNDIHWGNLVIDDQGEIHFIDFGRVSKATHQNKDDIVQMLLLFFTPTKERSFTRDTWIFGDFVGGYRFSYSRPELDPDDNEYYLEKQTIHIYLNSNDKNAEGAYPIIRYAVLDPHGIYHEETLNLSALGIDNIISETKQFSWSMLEESKKALIENKILEITSRQGYTLSQINKNGALFHLLKDPAAFYTTPTVPTALDIAETLTLSRLQLETFQSSFAASSQDIRLEAILILNSISIQLLALYEKINALPNKSKDFDQLIKNHLITHLIVHKDEKEDFSDTLNSQFAPLNENDARLLRHSIDGIIIGIDHARQSWRAKNTPISHDEVSLQREPKSPDILESEFSIGVIPSAVPEAKPEPEVKLEPKEEPNEKKIDAISAPHQSLQQPQDIPDVNEPVIDERAARAVAQALKLCTAYYKHFKADFRTEAEKLSADDYTLDLGIRKCYHVNKMMSILANPSETSDVIKMKAFVAAFKEAKPVIVQRRDHPAITFLKVIATIITVGLAQVLGSIWDVRGQEVAQKIAKIDDELSDSVAPVKK